MPERSRSGGDEAFSPGLSGLHFREGVGISHSVVLGCEMESDPRCPICPRQTKTGLRRAALRRWRLRVRVDVARVLRIFLCADVAVARRMHDAPNEFPTPAS